MHDAEWISVWVGFGINVSTKFKTLARCDACEQPRHGLCGVDRLFSEREVRNDLACRVFVLLDLFCL